MSLPPGFLDELRTRTSLSQVVGRKVMWDQRKSNQGKGDMWAPCPFHQEKTASFHVDDKQGFYYCFGCHAKGDAISFVRETENTSFMEAIEILAKEAGMSVPKRDPRAQAKADKRTQLAEVMEQAVQYFRLQLKTAAAASARDYLAGRGFDAKGLDRWEIGFAPDARQSLYQHLRAKSVPDELIIGAGLCAKPDDGGQPYDRFRGRIIFPIRDARGRAIALGGRAMDPNARAKYLNSPETELFDKGRSLYNHGPAREASGKGQPLIVAEGYMDVIALAEAGFTASVAPLGTAITEDQLRLMWRIHPEPIIALDGDKAGLRAAMRLIDLALPMLEAGQTLRFAMMPEGQDPDDLLRAQGPSAVQTLLDEAQPLVRLLWQRETEGRVFDSPERKAGLDKALREAIKKIQDPSLRSHYGQEINELRRELFRPSRSDARPDWRNTGAQGGGRFARKFVEMGAKPETKASALVSSQGAVAEAMRETVILAVLLKNPDQLPEFESALDTLQMHSPDLNAIRRALLDAAHGPAGDVLGLVNHAVGEGAVEKLFAHSHLSVIPAFTRPGDGETASLCLHQEFQKLRAERGMKDEIAEAERDLRELSDEGITYRLAAAAESRALAERSQTEDKTEYSRADNGVELNKSERDALKKLMDRIEFNNKK